MDFTLTPCLPRETRLFESLCALAHPNATSKRFAFYPAPKAFKGRGKWTGAVKEFRLFSRTACFENTCVPRQLVSFFRESRTRKAAGVVLADKVWQEFSCCDHIRDLLRDLLTVHCRCILLGRVNQIIIGKFQTCSFWITSSSGCSFRYHIPNSNRQFT